MRQDLTYEFLSVMPTARQAGAMISTATFQQRTNTVSSTGQPDLADWVNVAGLVNIQCQLSVQSAFRPDQGGVRRMPMEFDTINLRHLLLGSYYPAVLQQYTVLVDGTRYEIMAVEHDSTHNQTRCAVRIYTL